MMDIATTLEFETFHGVVATVFNNWTALKLALEHGMAGPPAIAYRKLQAMVDAVSDLLNTGNTEWETLSDYLADTMDSEFSTVLEDDSNDEVGYHVWELYQLYRSNNFQQISAALSQLPNPRPLELNVPVQKIQRPADPSDEEDTEDTAAQNTNPEDDEWTVVKKR